MSNTSALITFSAKNVRSFRETAELSMLATGVAEKPYVRSLRWRAGGRPIKALAVAGVFGANASGKSNLLGALSDLRALVLNPFSITNGSPTRRMARNYFLLDNALKSEPSSFDVQIILNGTMHEYGVTFDDERVLEEWAYWYPKGRAARVFHREGQKVLAGSVERSKTRTIAELLRPDVLFLSIAAFLGHQALLPLFEWFRRNLKLVDQGSLPLRQVLTAHMLNDDELRRRVIGLLRAADLGVVGAGRHQVSPEMQKRIQKALHIIKTHEFEFKAADLPEFEDLGVSLLHRGADGRPVELNPEVESLGTRVWFGLIGPLILAMRTGDVLLVDELDASLHPEILREVVRLFQEQETNPNCAQLIFNAHDTNLLGDTVGPRILGRDQIWFTDKLIGGNTVLRPLTDEDPRKHEAIAKRYMEGRYGAVPIISEGPFDLAVTPEQPLPTASTTESGMTMTEERLSRVGAST